jgi:acyl-CoA synthetase (AMP-forming)/AMP-acid ligase II
LPDLWNSVASKAVAGTAVRIAISTGPFGYLGDLGGQDPPSPLTGLSRLTIPGAIDLAELVRDHRGDRPDPVEVGPSDVALLTYTSGTTGEPKGALSVGVPVFNTVARIVGEDGNDLPPGEIGEIVTSGPMVVPGYWNRPDATQRTLPGGELHTGDVGVRRRRRRS